MHFKKKKKKENTDAYAGQCFLALSKCTLFFEKRVSAKPMHFQQVTCTVHGTHEPFFLPKLSLKMGFTATIYIFNNYFVIVFSVFSFQKNKKYPNRPIVYACVQIAFLVLRLRFPSSSFLLFIFIFFIEKCISRGILSISGSCALCTGPTTSLSSKILTRMCLSVSPMHYSQDPQTFFLTKHSLKMDLIALFTHLKIILLQYFQFLVFSFQ